MLPPAVARARRKLSIPAPPRIAGGMPPAANLTLAAGTLKWEGSRDWHQRFRDIEVTISLHRWNWLLRGLTDGARLSADAGIQLMRSWLAECLDNPAVPNEPYTAGERIANGTIFLLLANDGEIPGDLTEAFRYMGHEVAKHLEYYSLRLTGNHAFNNGRALLCAAVATEWPEAADLAFEIARERLPRLITEDGFLCEGSSHYHFLMTRWVLESLWLARRVEHRPLITLLEPAAEQLVRQCWWFLVRCGDDWQMPLLGDVSPDCPPRWLVALPWSRLAVSAYAPSAMPPPPREPGWAGLFMQPCQ